jgi:hypothetical protein
MRAEQTRRCRGWKLHRVCDAWSTLVRLQAGHGQQNEVDRAAEFISGLNCDFGISARAYDAEPFHDTILEA